ncbi:MAG: NifB/NifX family molybdenum-iron cluster-binding protein [Salinivirgaceae bacterium]|nr:NifB/NifX family molybdenum-iron cluster-binding protein [Salinivirgaceae bacterium]
MKIAIPTRNNQVDDHFGHCEYFTVVTVTENKVIDTEVVPSQQGCGCKSNIVEVLKEKGVSIMLAGNMGQGALNKISNANISVVRGCSGNIEQLITNYLEGKIVDANILCDHSSEDHQCSH